MTCSEAIRAFPRHSRVIPLERLTTWRIGGPCAVIFPDTPGLLFEVMEWVGETGVPWTMIGRGSNLLAPTRGWEGVAVRLDGELSSHSFLGCRATAGGGASLPNLAGAACSRGLQGLVFAVGIPGTLGGAVFMNAGAYGESMAGIVREARVALPGGGERVFSREECGFDYRTSVFQSTPGALYRVSLELSTGDRERLRSEAAEILDRRREKFPLGVPNAGSVFRRPFQGPPPGRLLEDCGLKGFCFGGARFSPVHANFIENTGGATSEDVLNLIGEARRRVLEATGIELHEEIRILGGEC